MTNEHLSNELHRLANVPLAPNERVSDAEATHNRAEARKMMELAAQRLKTFSPAVFVGDDELVGR